MTHVEAASDVIHLHDNWTMEEFSPVTPYWEAMNLWFQNLDRHLPSTPIPTIPNPLVMIRNC